MPTITTDSALRQWLDQLSADQQKLIGVQFVNSVAHLCQDERLRRALDAVLSPNADTVALEDAYRTAKARATKTYTDCGKDTNWLAQADHFVAAALAAALVPEHLLSERSSNRAWKAAMQARMANNCELMEGEIATSGSEAERQYAIAQSFAA